ncbi:MAG: helix-turn-helix domain-containing protein [Planctomycetes bacterium]|nr:helix-turn-helix domain-containing protein [Planctomycetota bacterium]MCH9726982.1 helix-turn-helix domain-containing protein [Planctomycetota bacterium]MCH9775228.1 helix-turn-helix domain-containing protein [Planctomycetota bacterium]MCH9790019.1 helix-turn-helix domain-containing protein [Planctomycetota bacterium]
MKNANLHEERLTLNEVAKRLKVHVATVYRWTLQGVRGRRLPSFFIGGRRYIKLSDLEWFLQPKDQSISEGDPQRSKRANERLRSFGINSPKGQDGAA